MSAAALALGIAVAGGLGAAARHLVDHSLPVGVRMRFPWGIMVINLSGSLALGLLTGLALDHPVVGIATVGFLGGYTTFSTASLESVRLLAAKRYGAALLAGPGMLLLCAALSLIGIVIVRH